MKKKTVKSYYPKANEIEQNWVLYDASNKVLGRAAVDIAALAMGKYSANFTPGVNQAHHVVVTNVSNVLVTGKKKTDKMYYRHSGYPGGLKTTNYQALIEKKPCEALKKAVVGMLPKNSYGRHLIKNIIFYEGEEHQQSAQKPVAFKG